MIDHIVEKETITTTTTRLLLFPKIPKLLCKEVVCEENKYYEFFSQNGMPDAYKRGRKIVVVPLGNEFLVRDTDGDFFACSQNGGIVPWTKEEHGANEDLMLPDMIDVMARALAEEVFKLLDSLTQRNAFASVIDGETFVSFDRAIWKIGCKEVYEKLTEYGAINEFGDFTTGYDRSIITKDCAERTRAIKCIIEMF